MKKTLNNIFDAASANEIDNLVKQNAAPEVSVDTLSSIKDKVYAKTNLKKEKKLTKGVWLRLGAIAACFLMIVSAVIVTPMLFEEDSPVAPSVNGSADNENDSTIVSPNSGLGNDGEGEFQLESYYDFEINSDTFTAYIRGKVIDAEKIDAKLESATVTGGWKNEAGEWISTEVLNAELYRIKGIDSGIAVALRFIDQGEGATTIHYYVMMNPNADLSDVEEYVRDPIVPVPDNPYDEYAEEKVLDEYEITIQYENRRYGYTLGQNDEVKARYSLGENIPTNFTRTVEGSDIVSINETFDKQSLIGGKIIPCNNNVLIVSTDNGAYYYFELIVAGGANN